MKQITCHVNEMKQTFLDNGWTQIKEAETYALLKDEDDSLYTLSLLTEETNHFQQLEPLLAASSILRVYCEEEAEDDLTLTFELEGYGCSITAVISDLVDEGVYCYVSKTDCLNENKEVKESRSDIATRPSFNQQLNRIYKSFKTVITESSLYRLHFVTNTIVFDSDPFLKDE